MSVSNINFNDKNEAFLVLSSMDEMDKNEFKNYMDLENPHFLNCEFENDKEFKLFYSYGHYVPLKTFLSQIMTKEKALTFIKSLNEAFIEADKLKMNKKHILLGVQSVFCHQETGKVACIYVPVCEGILPERPLRLFLKEVLVNMMYSEEEDMCWLGELIRYINNHRQLDHNVFDEYIDELYDVKKTVPEPYVPASVPEDDTNPVISISKTEKETDEPTYYLYRRSNHQAYTLNKMDMRIGKAQNNEICITDNPVISRVHAIIRYVDDAFVIEDHGATNHTFVNGFVLKEGQVKVLSVNDRILLGNEEFIFKIQ